MFQIAGLPNPFKSFTDRGRFKHATICLVNTFSSLYWHYYECFWFRNTYVRSGDRTTLILVSTWNWKSHRTPNNNNRTKDPMYDQFQVKYFFNIVILFYILYASQQNLFCLLLYRRYEFSSFGICMFVSKDIILSSLFLDQFYIDQGLKFWASHLKHRSCTIWRKKI